MTLEQAAGATLLVAFLADIFLTILYARAGTGLMAPYWNRAVWRVIRGFAELSGGRRGLVLSFAGPLIVVLLIAFWSLGLTTAAALIVQPALGTAIRSSTGSTPTDFVTALLVAGSSLSIVGAGHYAPYTTGARVLYLINSLIGTSVLSLVLSYLVQVYSALRDRNALAMTIDLMTEGTGDAAEMLARLMPDGDSKETASELGDLVRPLAAIKEAHHFYPLLFYFRFEDPLYSVSRFSFVLLDLTTIVDTVLDERKYGALAKSSAVPALRRGGGLLLKTLEQTFPSAKQRGEDPAEVWRERRSWLAAMETLTRSGIATRADSADAYLERRRLWERPIRRLAPMLGFDLDDVDRRGRCGDAATPTP